MYYIFDGTYPGLLTAVFDSFVRKEFDAIPVKNAPSDLFFDHRIITTDLEKATRIQKGLIKNVGSSVAKDFYRAFLSEDPKAWEASLKIQLEIFKGNPSILQNYGDHHVLYFAQTLKKVSRERHRMKAFIRFQKSNDGLYFAVIEPDFNVLPLIADFLKNRYAGQPWLIYDLHRKYGLHHENGSIAEVQLSPEEKTALSTQVNLSMDEKDEHFQKLWKQYFKSTNIEARKNMKLHLRHVPKRYWKHLTEKQ
jgi:probable DNA metabolism protein